MVGVDGRRRGDRLPGLPQRRPGRHGRRDHLHRHRTVGLDAVHVHRRRRRRRGQRLGPVDRCDRDDLLRRQHRQRLHGGLFGHQPVGYGLHRRRDGEEQRHDGKHRLEGELVLERQPADQQRLERRPVPRRFDRGRHQRGLQRLDRPGRHHGVRLPGRLLGHEHRPDPDLHHDLTPGHHPRAARGLAEGRGLRRA
ncbi:hypothetical protein SBRY_100114 [Actinacidiphila bryophytorum]|uniref:Uncharacterized protein n=1 Tax=Actinacidiphila bryophytorum TaxID=1436133 RepID=A0A9W4E121_9ACTN|nr:hypothetical protein SBRY_100114 [Actinacidiphila bryophytorum]